MSNARRTVIRPRQRDRTSTAAPGRRQQRLQLKLGKAEAALARWQKRLLRACSAVIKHQKQVARLLRLLQELST